LRRAAAVDESSRNASQAAFGSVPAGATRLPGAFMRPPDRLLTLV
jgi:hypothetical protein